MTGLTAKSIEQQSAESTVEAFRRELGPFVVAAEKTRMPMVFTDAKEPGHPIIFANEAFIELTGYDREEVLAKSLSALMEVGIDEDACAAVEAAFEHDSGTDPEIRYRRKDGSEFWASVFVSPVCDESGAVVQHFVSFVDLTRHREENLALSRSHDLLTLSSWRGAGLHDLVDIALQPFEVVPGRAERFTIRGDNVQLPPNATLSLAIALHELATNAVKYGAFSNDAGTIAIDWTVAPGVDRDRLVLRWRERDGPPVTPPTHEGFGSWVIERGLAHELGGRVALDYLPGGVACTIDIPSPVGAAA